MFGLAVLFFIAIYIAFLLWVARGSYRYALQNGQSKRQAMGWGFVGGFVVWLAVFWDWLPTEVAYRYYCERDAGVTVFKTLEKWLHENPDASDAFGPPQQNKSTIEGEKSFTPLSRRFMLQSGVSPVFMSVSRLEQTLVDVSKNENLAQEITYYSGYGSMALGGPNSWKEWLRNGGCKVAPNNEFSLLIKRVTYGRK